MKEEEESCASIADKLTSWSRKREEEDVRWRVERGAAPRKIADQVVLVGRGDVVSGKSGGKVTLVVIC